MELSFCVVFLSGSEVAALTAHPRTRNHNILVTDEVSEAFSGSLTTVLMAFVGDFPNSFLTSNLPLLAQNHPDDINRHKLTITKMAAIFFKNSKHWIVCLHVS